MSLYNFKGGQFEISMADATTAQLIAATEGLALSYGNAKPSDVTLQTVGNAQDRDIGGIGGI